jgi:hypothetical protein
MKLDELVIEAPGRQVVEQINLQLQDYPNARNAAAAVFKEAYTDQGGNHVFSVRVSQDTDSEAISVSVQATGAPAPVPPFTPPPVVSEAEAARIQEEWLKAHPAPQLTSGQEAAIAARVARKMEGSR